MTVAELLQILQGVDPKTPVYVFDSASDGSGWVDAVAKSGAVNIVDCDGENGLIFCLAIKPAHSPEW